MTKQTEAMMLTDPHDHPEPHTMKWTQLEMDYINKRVEMAVRQAIEQAQQAEQMELPEPRLTGTFSIRAGKFRCTGCTGSWTNKEDAKQHSCKDYQ